MGQVKIICAWHPKNFGSELVMRTVEWPGIENRESHGICPACEKLEMPINKKIITAHLWIDTFVVALSAAILWHFSTVWWYGTILIQEPNRLVLTIETIGLALILVFGIVQFIRDLKRA